MRSCHTSCGARRRRSTLHLLLCLYLATAPCTDVTAMSWTCSLNSVPVETIPVHPPVKEEDGQRRSLRVTSESDAIIVPPELNGIEHQHQMRRKVYTYDEDIDSNNSYPDIFDMATTFGAESSNETTVVPDESNTFPYLEARRCICATGYAFSPDDKYYCTTPSNHCSVWRSRYRHDYRVTCYEYKDWKVGFARNVWYYLCFALLMLILYPIFSRPGQVSILFCYVNFICKYTPPLIWHAHFTSQHAVRYLLSKCFPRMNPWITEQILQTEIQARNRIRDQFEYALRQKRRTEGTLSNFPIFPLSKSRTANLTRCAQIGWVSGYSLKTKRYIASEEDTALGNNTQSDSERECKTNDETNPEEDEDVRATSSQDDQSIVSGNMCTICLLAVEDGEKVADLACGHLYHAECLGEWILKKVRLSSDVLALSHRVPCLLS